MPSNLRDPAKEGEVVYESNGGDGTPGRDPRRRSRAPRNYGCSRWWRERIAFGDCRGTRDLADAYAKLIKCDHDAGKHPPGRRYPPTHMARVASRKTGQRMRVNEDHMAEQAAILELRVIGSGGMPGQRVDRSTGPQRIAESLLKRGQRLEDDEGHYRDEDPEQPEPQLLWELERRYLIARDGQQVIRTERLATYTVLGKVLAHVDELLHDDADAAA